MSAPSAQTCHHARGMSFPITLSCRLDLWQHMMMTNRLHHSPKAVAHMGNDGGTMLCDISFWAAEKFALAYYSIS